MTQDISDLTWPLSRLGELITALAQHGGLSSQETAIPTPPAELNETRRLIRPWAQYVAAQLGLELEPVVAAYRELIPHLRAAAPAILVLTGDSDLRFLGVVKGRHNHLVLLGADKSRHKVPLAAVRATLCQPLEAPLAGDLDRVLANAQVPQRRRAKARAAILQEQLSQTDIRFWLLSASPRSNFVRQLRQAGAFNYLLGFLATHWGQYFLWLLSWGIIGRAVFRAQIDTGWFLAWALILLTIVPLRALVGWWQGQTAVRVGGLLQRRLLYGALRQHPDEIRHMGVGQLMGRVFEADTVETLALRGGFIGLLALVELSLSAWVLSQGAGGRWQVLLLVSWLGVACLLGYRFYLRRGRWTETRRTLTHDLIEHMVGHRTRLVQTTPDDWHQEEDKMLARYLADSIIMDKTWVRMRALIARGWLLVGLAGLIPFYIQGINDVPKLAIALGGVLSAELALRKLGQSFTHLSEAAIAWGQIGPLYQAAARPELVGSLESGVFFQPANGPANGRAILDARGLRFRYQEQGDAVLEACDLQIQAGDRVLVEGASGGGKSTLVSLFSGLRKPHQGLLQLHGLNRQTAGAEAWRRRIVTAPQFQENFVFTGQFLFNLVLGRNWPTVTGDSAAAWEICQELGLDDVIRRMPGGIQQIVGETGWQLSHGERSRLYIARALLQQDADLIILDESFAALDPGNLYRAVNCVLKRAPALMVIAHP